jgi:hypothetical protein
MAQEFPTDPNNLVYATSFYADDGNHSARHPSTAGLSRDDGGGPEGLFVILENSLPDETIVATQDEIQRRREVVEQAWDQVRRWLRTHDDPQVRAEAASIRGQADVAPLHLICKLSNPPTDIVRAILDASHDAASSVDAHGWLPLHYACAKGASTEVLQVLIEAYPEGKLVQDNQSRTPLHFYVTRNSDLPTVMATNVSLLSDSGAAAMPDRGGMFPIHYACAYGNYPAVLKVLKDAYPEGITVRESKGRTPMHLAMSNTHRETSPGVLSFLIENEGQFTFKMRDDEGNTPLHMLNLGLKDVDVDDPENMHHAAECLKLYLGSSPEPSPDFLASLQALPEWLQEVAVVSPHVRDILNEKIVQRFPTSILMLDGYMLAVIIVCFEIATTYHIDRRFDLDSLGDFKETGVGQQSADTALILLNIGAGYFLLRELVQVVALWSLGSLASWFYDTTNWLDMAVIILTFHYSFVMILAPDPFLVPDSEPPTILDDYNGMGRDQFRTGCSFTKGVLWMAVIFFLKSTQVDFAVFLGGVFYVVQRLVAFLLAVGVILLAFAQMFFIVYLQDDVCVDDNDPDTPKFPHCEFGSSLLKVKTDLAVAACLESPSEYISPSATGLHNDDGRNWI